MARWAMRPEVALFTLLFGVYAYFFPGGGWNQNSRFALTRALVEHHTTIIDAYPDATRDLAMRDGHLHSDKAPGASVLAAIPYGLLVALRGVPRDRALDDAAYACTLLVSAIPSALGCVAIHWALLGLGARCTRAMFAAVAYGFATLVFPYATMLYGHALAAALLAVALALLVATRRGRPRPASLGAILGAVIAVEYHTAIAAGVVGLVAWTSDRRGRARMLAGMATPLVLLATYHACAFGSPFRLPYSFSTQAPRHLGVWMGIGLPDPRVIGALLFGARRGLLASAPWLLAASLGLVRLARQPDTRAVARACIVVSIAFLLVNASLVDWDGGSAFGPRYLVPAIPFLVIGAAAPVASAYERVLASVGASLAAVSAAWMFVAVAVDPQPSRTIARPLRDHLLPAFASGDLAKSGQAIDHFVPEGASRAWNIGMRLGLGGTSSLVPLAIFVAIAGAWLAIATRRADATEARTSR